jgi:hypothetical protein
MFPFESQAGLSCPQAVPVSIINMTASPAARRESICIDLLPELAQNVVHRASRRSCSTANECAFLRAVARACTNSGAASRSNRSNEHCGASREAEHTKGYCRIRHSVFHFSPPSRSECPTSINFRVVFTHYPFHSVRLMVKLSPFVFVLLGQFDV